MKNLLGRLMSRPFDELKVIAFSWGALTRDPSPSHNDLAIALYHAMIDPSAARGVWESLDPEMRAFTTWLLDQRNMLALVDDLPSHLDRPPAEVEGLLERVRHLGLIDVDEALVRGSRVVSSGDNLYAWGARNQPEAVRRRVVSLSAEAGKVLRLIIDESKRPAPFEESFAALLQHLEQEQVQRIAATWKLPEAARYYKSELIGVMSEFLATGQGRQLLLNALPPASQSTFELVEELGGRARASEVRRHFDWNERDFRAATLPLIQRALLWDVLEENSRYLFIPLDLLATRNSQPGTRNSELGTRIPQLAAPPPHTIEGKLPYELTWDLLTLLSAASHAELPLTLQDTRITKRVARRINDAFLHPDDLKNGQGSRPELATRNPQPATGYIDMVVHLAQTLGLLAEKQGEQPALVVTPSRADEWAGLTFAAQRRRLFALWEEDRKWSEPATYGTIYWWNSDLTGGRKNLINHLLELPIGQWIQLDAFLRKIHATEPFIIWSQDELVRRFGLRALQGFRSQWFTIEGRILADMIKTMLYWLGAVELGRDKQKRLLSFRVTEDGRALLDPEHDNGVRHPSKTLLVQPNFEVLVVHPESKVVWDLMRSADLVRHDRVSVYSLSKESVSRAAEAGLTAEYIKEFLHKNTGKSLPQNVAHSIDDWSRLVKRAGVRRVTLIEVADPSLLDEMLASRKTRKLIAERLSPTVAVARLPEVTGAGRDDPWQKLLKELKSAGISARIAPGDTHVGPVEPQTENPENKDEGRVTRNQELPNGRAEPEIGDVRRANLSNMRRGKRAQTATTHRRGKTGTE